MIKRTLLPILAATAWISISEFVRNQFLLQRYWTDHFAALGLTFPAQPVNGAVWGVWSMCYAAIIFVLAKRYSLMETATLAWVIGFVLMWLVIGNLGVLPFGIMLYAVPLSMLEAWLATVIIKRMTRSSN